VRRKQREVDAVAVPGRAQSLVGTSKNHRQTGDKCQISRL
jgi:hypothetical protein